MKDSAPEQRYGFRTDQTFQGIPDPTRIDHFVDAYTVPEVPPSNDVAPSWAGGGEPARNYYETWVDQATREISGQQVTMVPFKEYFVQPDISNISAVEPRPQA